MEQRRLELSALDQSFAKVKGLNYRTAQDEGVVFLQSKKVGEHNVPKHMERVPLPFLDPLMIHVG